MGQRPGMSPDRESDRTLHTLELHRWQEFRTEGGNGWYKKCRDCGKFRYIDNRPKYI